MDRPLQPGSISYHIVLFNATCEAVPASFFCLEHRSKAEHRRKMGKTSAPAISEAVDKLKDKGNALFVKRQYADAIKEYEAAIQQLPEEAPGAKVDLLCNKAACYYQMKQ